MAQKYLFIAIFSVKMSRVNKALGMISKSKIFHELNNLFNLKIGLIGILSYLTWFVVVRERNGVTPGVAEDTP